MRISAQASENKCGDKFVIMFLLMSTRLAAAIFVYCRVKGYRQDELNSPSTFPHPPPSVNRQ